MIRFIPGSTVKLEQLIGDEDKQLHRPTLSQTGSRFKLQGTDLGYSFENNGSAMFLFGDVVGVLGKALDAVGTTNARDPDRGVRLDFLTTYNHTYLPVTPPGIDMGAFDVPVSGINLVNRTYVVVKTDHSSDATHPTDRSVLTQLHLSSILLNPSWFDTLRTISRLPSGHFIKMSMHTQTEPLPGVPSAAPYVLLWGTGWYRHSDAFLSVVPSSRFETGEGTLYFKGQDRSGAPMWSPHEPDAKSIATNGTMGDLSVTWCESLRLWLMTYDSRPPAQSGILFRYASTPWGQWSQPQVLFDAVTDSGYGKFIHDPAIRPDDGLEGPVIGKGQAHPAAVKGATYAPYVIERWTKVQGSELDLYYVMSTWNPYVVMLMKSRFRIE